MPGLSFAALAAAAAMAPQARRLRGRHGTVVSCRAKRPRVDPDAANAFDDAASGVLEHTGLLQAIGGHDRKPIVDPFQRANNGHVAKPRAADNDDSVLTSRDFEASVAMRVEGELAPKQAPAPAAPVVVTPEDFDGAEVPDMLAMSEVQRADLIDGLTQKAFVLMESGEIQEAKELLDRASRIGGLFQQLLAAQEDNDEAGRRRSIEDKLKSEQEILVELKRDLDPQDFLRVFGDQARFAGILGKF